MTKRNRAPIGSLEHDLGQLSHALTAASSGRAGVERRQRFTKDRPCPICGGYGELPRGQHRRCWGFISDDGEWAHCMREEHAGGLQRHQGSNGFAHRLVGECCCGRSHGNDHHSSGDNHRNTTRIAAPDQVVYRYEDEDGLLLFEVRRSATKQFLVFHPTAGGYKSGLGGTRKVLYRLPRLTTAIANGEKIFVVEGEKDVDALGRIGTGNVEGYAACRQWHSRTSPPNSTTADLSTSQGSLRLARSGSDCHLERAPFTQ